MEIGFNPNAGNTDPLAAAFGNQDLGRFEFLELLVAQLANQNPLEPVANTEFVSQMAQFSSVEELVKIRQLGEVNAAMLQQLLAGLAGQPAPGPEAPPGGGEEDPSVDFKNFK